MGESVDEVQEKREKIPGFAYLHVYEHCTCTDWSGGLSASSMVLLFSVFLLLYSLPFFCLGFFYIMGLMVCTCEVFLLLFPFSFVFMVWPWPAPRLCVCVCV